MDLKFTSNLQTVLNKVGREGRFKPPVSQDPVDRIMHERYVGDIMYKIGNERRDHAKDRLVDAMDKAMYHTMLEQAKLREETISGMIFQTGDYSMKFTAKKGNERFNKQRAMIELIKLGVDEVTIKKAFEAATGRDEPSKIVEVLPILSRAEADEPEVVDD